MKNKVKILIRCILFVLLIVPLSIKAEGGNFSDLSIDVDAGANFSLSIDVASLEDATTIEAILEYDPAILTFISVEADSASVMAPLFELGIIFATSSAGLLEKMSVSVPALSATYGSGELVNVVFKLVDDASGSTNISLDSLVVYKEDFSFVSATLGADYVVNVTSPDPSTPLRTEALPSGTLSHDTTQVDISLTTDVNTTCRYSTNSDIAFDSQSLFATTGGTGHSQTITGLTSDSSYNYYVKCRNELGVTNTTNYLIAFSVDFPPFVVPPSGGGGGGGGGNTNPVIIDKTLPAPITNLTLSEVSTGIRLDWSNPGNSDFSKVLVCRLNKTVVDHKDVANVKINSLNSYETTSEYYIDDIVSDYKNYYILYAQDDTDNYSLALVTKSIKEELSDTTTVQVETEETIIDEKNIEEGVEKFKYGAINSLFGVTSDVVEAVSQKESLTIIENKQFVDLSAETLLIYEKVMAGKDIIDDDIKYNIAYFIHHGTQTTISLGAGERGGVLNSYYSAFSKMPKLEEEWKDIIKIANGRWPTERNTSLEETNQTDAFNTIYKRTPNMTIPSDNAAVTVITYGLRPANRNLESEKKAIVFFRAIFTHDPSTATDWDIVRAIAYSGAIR